MRVLARINGEIHGDVSVADVSGSVLHHVRLRDVVVQSEQGDEVLTLAAAELHYRLGNIIRGRFVFDRITLDEPQLHITQPAPGVRPTVLTILPESGPAGGGPAPLVAAGGIEVQGGAVHVSLMSGGASRSDTALVLTDVQGVFSGVRLSSPDRGDIPGARIDELRAAVRTPDWGAMRLSGSVQWIGDSLIVALPVVAVSETQGSATGWIATSGGFRTDLNADVQSVGAADMARIVPDLTDGATARGLARIRARPDGVYEIDGTDLEVVGARSGTVTGHIAITAGPQVPWRIRDARLVLEAVSPHRAWAGVDTMRFGGTLDGVVAARGERADLFVDADVSWRYTGEARPLRSLLRAAGSVDGSDLHDVELQAVRIAEFSVALPTIRRLVPSVPFDGRVVMRGDVSGSTLDPSFTGRIVHVGSSPAVSTLRGDVAVSRRGRQPTVVVALAFDSLQPHTWSPLFPTVPLTGPLAGQLTASGHVDSIALHGWLEADAGTVRGSLSAARRPGGVALTGLAIEALGVDLARADTAMPHTSLNGALTGQVVLTGGRPATAIIRARSDSSSWNGARVDSAAAWVRLYDDLLELDTVMAWAPGVSIAGGGTLGTAGAQAGVVRFAVAADTSTLFERLAGTAVPGPWSSGPLQLTGVLEGSVRDYTLDGMLTGQRPQYGTLAAGRLMATGRWISTTGAITLDADVDTLDVGGTIVTSVVSRLAGNRDSLGWRLAAAASGTAVVGAGSTWQDARGRNVSFDSLGFRSPGAHWVGAPGASIAVGADGAIRTQGVTVQNEEGPGRVTVVGALVPRGDAHLDVRLEDLPLEGLVAVIWSDSIDAGGSVDAELTVQGTPASPVAAAQFTLRDPRLGSLGASRIAGVADYADRRVGADVEVHDDTLRLASVAGEFPFDLAVRPANGRTIPGPVRVSGFIDTLALSRLATFVPQLDDPRGFLTASLDVRGTIADPVLSGQMNLRDGEVGMPALGTRYGDIHAAVSLSRDTVYLRSLSMRSGDGTARMTGHAWLERLDQPVLDLRVDAENFRAVALPDFLTLTASGQLAVQGPPDQATLTLQAVANRGTLAFADLLSKQIVDLSDTLFASFVDTAALRQEGIGVERSRRLLERLDIDSAFIDLGDDFWLRSTEGDIQLTGQLLAAKRGTEYRVDGTLNAARGTYRLQVAPGVSREFIVTSGRVQYLGTPDLNADLDIDAQHTVRTFGGEQVTVMVHIGGTLYEPTLTFSSDVLPPLSEPEIISYLVFGTPDVQAFAGHVGPRGFLFQQGADQLAMALSDRLERSVINSLGLPVDYFQIRPGDPGRGFSDTEIAIGKRLAIFGRPAFLTASPRLCPRQRLVSVQNVGASLETWLHRRWLLTASVDPFRGCEASATPSPSRYQLGVDLVWERRR